jgi:hypothetical protein
MRDPRRLGGARACPLKGFVAPKLPAVTHADLATTIRVHVGKRPVHPGPKVKPRKGFPPMGPIARDVAVGSVISNALYFPYRCHGTVQIDVGYTQQRRPSQMPFDIGGFGDAKVGRVFAKLR